ncbi:MAG: hypothetical protein HFE84_10130 [Lachnospiraceae bacterium]|nr:hypothetical protein [Lachnospiraceae bacterium]
MKRIAVFTVYDKDGVLYAYRRHILKELRAVADRVIVVCNGPMEPGSKKALYEMADEVFFRTNSGYDAFAYKYALEEAVGWAKLEQYDELLLMNDSFYGPFWLMADILEEMAERDADFWGLTAQPPMANTFGSAYFYRELPYHIQTYFLVVRDRLLHAPAFCRFWDTLEPVNGFTDAVTKFELRFTAFFQKEGFLAASYVDCACMEQEKTENRLPYIMYEPYEMIKEHHCPILKRKCFTMPYSDILQYSVGQDAKRALEFISRHTDYDEGMIWEHLIRTVEPGKLQQALHLSFILPSAYTSKKDRSKTHKTAVIAHVNYPELLEECFAYLCRVPARIDLYITTKSLDIKKKLEEKFYSRGRLNVKVRMIGDRGREIRGMLIECADVFREYEYVGYVHDKRTAGNAGEAKIGEIYRSLLWDNMLKSSAYINNALALLEENTHIGLLAPPEPYHGNYFRYLGQEWTQNYQTTCELASRLKLQCVLEEDCPPFVLGTTFWCKSRALAPLIDFGFSENDFEEEPLGLDGTINHAIERIFQYAAQSQGYASGIVMNDAFASDYFEDYHCMLNGVLSEFRKTEKYCTLRECMEFGDTEALKEFCGRYKSVYVYGTGSYAAILTDILRNLKVDWQGYVVSEGHRTKNRWKGRPVCLLSEIEKERREVGLILALDKIHQAEVLPALREKDFTNIYRV